MILDFGNKSFIKVANSWELTGRKFPISKIPEAILKEEQFDRCNVQLFNDTPMAGEELEFWAFLMKLTFFNEERLSEDDDIAKDDNVVAGVTETVSETTQLLLAFTEQCIKMELQRCTGQGTDQQG